MVLSVRSLRQAILLGMCSMLMSIKHNSAQSHTLPALARPLISLSAYMKTDCMTIPLTVAVVTMFSDGCALVQDITMLYPNK